MCIKMMTSEKKGDKHSSSEARGGNRLNCIGLISEGVNSFGPSPTRPIQQSDRESQPLPDLFIIKTIRPDQINKVF